MLGVRAVRLRFPFPGRRRDFCSHADCGLMILAVMHPAVESARDELLQENTANAPAFSSIGYTIIPSGQL